MAAPVQYERNVPVSRELASRALAANPTPAPYARTNAYPYTDVTGVLLPNNMLVSVMGVPSTYPVMLNADRMPYGANGVTDRTYMDTYKLAMPKVPKITISGGGGGGGGRQQTEPLAKWHAYTPEQAAARGYDPSKGPVYWKMNQDDLASPHLYRDELIMRSRPQPGISLDARITPRQEDIPSLMETARQHPEWLPWNATDIQRGSARKNMNWQDGIQSQDVNAQNNTKPSPPVSGQSAAKSAAQPVIHPYGRYRSPSWSLWNDGGVTVQPSNQPEKQPYGMYWSPRNDGVTFQPSNQPETQPVKPVITNPLDTVAMRPVVAPQPFQNMLASVLAQQAAQASLPSILLRS